MMTVDVHSSESNPSSLAWPEITASMRPWTRWWWPGGAVDERNITRLLEEYARVGLGGVEVTHIYGVKGQEARFIEYLSPQWQAMVQHTLREAERLGMGVDLVPGSGWRIGGPFVPEELGGARFVIQQRTLEGKQYFQSTFPEMRVRAILAVSASGVRLRATHLLDAQGRFTWHVPEGRWTLFVAGYRLTGEPVKRAGPGGHGRAINPFSRQAFEMVKAHLTPIFRELPIRAQFHDSWEYSTDTIPEWFDEFRRRRGYDLERYLPELAGQGDAETIARVLGDVRQTLGELALEHFIAPWVTWCHSLGHLARNQAHGSPGNVLDLYAVADIPETEVFRRVEPHTPLLSKLASSAAHVVGRPLTSSETGTWLDEHFTVTLAKVKHLVDNLFVSGINHVVYHGTAYSPDDVPWPGWLFYASTQFNPQNPFWRHFPQLNTYITRCQSILQSGEPDNDLLVYLPVADVFASENPRRLLAQLTIEGQWLLRLPARETFEFLWHRGYPFDYVSDRQLQDAQVHGGQIRTPGATYRAVVVPRCRFLPLNTLEALVALARGGGTVLFHGAWPQDVPGLGQLEARRQKFQAIFAAMNLQEIAPGVRMAPIGQGRVVLAEELEAAFRVLGIRRESLVDHRGMQFIRRRHPQGRDYFLVNAGDQFLDDWVPLATRCCSVGILDPMTGRAGVGRVRATDDGYSEVYLQLAPGESQILRTFADGSLSGEPWLYLEPAGEPIELRGSWQVTFIEGGPVLPESYATEHLESWTVRGDDAARFAGTARYVLHFDAPAEGSLWEIDLGEVHESAQIRLNGQDWGVCIAPPFRAVVTQPLKAGENVLEVEVANLAANRIRDLDRRGVAWKVFHDINLVNLAYRPFDASEWPVRASGLLGPVRLTPMRPIR